MTRFCLIIIFVLSSGWARAVSFCAGDNGVLILEQDSWSRAEAYFSADDLDQIRLVFLTGRPKVAQYERLFDIYVEARLRRLFSWREPVRQMIETLRVHFQDEAVVLVSPEEIVLPRALQNTVIPTLLRVSQVERRLNEMVQNRKPHDYRSDIAQALRREALIANVVPTQYVEAELQQILNADLSRWNRTRFALRLRSARMLPRDYAHELQPPERILGLASWQTVWSTAVIPLAAASWSWLF